MKIRKEKKQMKQILTRDKPQKGDDYARRDIAVRLNADGLPKTLNEDERSVEVVMSTEQPARVIDYERWEIINEILLMNGAKLPESKKIVMLDSHDRFSTDNIVGSARDIKVDGDKLIGRAFFAKDERSDRIWQKVKDGHLTDFSIGYSVDAKKTVRIEENAEAEVNGKKYKGPVVIRKSWTPMELSAVAIGADDKAKARSKNRHEVETEKFKTKQKTEGMIMDRDKLIELLGKMGIQFDENASDGDLVRLLEGNIGKKSEPKPEPKKGEPKEPETRKTVEVDTTPEVKIDVDEERKAAAVAERERINEITAMCRRFGFESMIEDFVLKGTSLEQARKIVDDRFDQTYKRDEETGKIAFAHAPRIVEDEVDKFRAAASDAVLLRTGRANEKTAPGADDLIGLTLKELARESLKRANIKPPAGVLDMVGRALTTSDLPNILSNVANKSLFMGYEQAEETWSIWCSTGSAPDFKSLEFPWASETSDLEEVPEGTEYRYSDLADRKESVQLATYGKILALTRQAIINDDLGALTDIPMKHGEAAARKIGDVVYAVLTANANMSDGNALFSATHANIATGGDLLPPGIASIGEAIRAMKVQTGQLSASRLNIRPRFYIAPVALEGYSEIFFGSDKFADEGTFGTPDDATATTRVNPYSGAYFTRVYDARLDSNSEKHWYLAGPADKTVRVFFLNGVQRPYLEMQSGWSVDGTEMKVRIDCAAKALDWRALYLNPDT